MDEQTLESIKEQIRVSLVSSNTANALALLLDLHPADQAEVFNSFGENEKEILLPLLDISSTADLLEEMEDEEVLEAVETLSTERLADVLDEMEPDEAADLLGDLPPAQASEVLAQMEDADEVIPLLGYPDESAGGLMTTAYVALRPHTSTEQAIKFLRQISPENDVPYYLYVIDRARRLIGVVGLRELIVSDPENLIESIMDPEVISIGVNSDQEEVARVMARYDLAAIPVVDERQRVVGVITHDDIVDVLEEEATEDIYRLATVSDTDLEPESPVVDHLKGRLPWLYLNMLTALFASWVVSNFEKVIGQVAILAAFQSVVAGLGGNSASQNVVMIVRSMALGKITARRIWAVLIRQVWIGFLQGLLVGGVVGTGVYIWRGDPVLAIVLFMAMICNMSIAGIIGTLVPFAITAIGKDPALASSVLVTAATDSFGFFIFLSLATLLLPYFIK
jgi:magnesium transporter